MAVTDCRVCATPLPSDARFCMTCGVDVTDPGATVQTKPRDAGAELHERLARTLAGRYEVRRLLGAGGMASVFLADEIGLDRPVAIKVLPPELARDEGLVARFEREAKTAARLDHPHIIPIHRVESEAGLHYFVMKYVPGRSLESLLEAPDAIPLGTASRILREAATALGHAHTRGVVHRDVKPANIMLDEDGRVVLTDFGIARAGESTHLTQTGMIIGTPHYMAPEQALGTGVDGRADQYALAVVAYEMLARQCPFTGDSAHTIIYKHIHEPPRSVASLRPDLPPHIVETIAIALAKDPKDRFATMEDFARAIDGDAAVFAVRESRKTIAIAAGAGSRAGQPTPSSVATVRVNAKALRTSPRRLRSAVWAGAFGGLVLVVGATLWAASGSVARGTHELDPALASDLEKTSKHLAALSSREPIASPAAPGGTPSATGEAAASEPGRPAGKSPNPRQQRGGVEPPPVRGSPDRAARAPERQAPRIAPLTIGSEPWGTLFIDDAMIGDTPVANHPLEVGRTYRIRVEREGYKSKSESITVRDPNPIRRQFTLDPGAAS
ncbi:MAG TPA: protein kinase [Gemmatimonadaceae bacterium]|nr:protein kinase [Gemmatimonadaceae bacterium]